MRWDVHQSLYERSATPWCHGFHFDTKLGRNITRRMRPGPDQTSQIPLSEGVSRSNLHEKSLVELTRDRVVAMSPDLE